MPGRFRMFVLPVSLSTNAVVAQWPRDGFSLIEFLRAELSQLLLVTDPAL